jgi:hypothetical protein
MCKQTCVSTLLNTHPASCTILVAASNAFFCNASIPWLYTRNASSQNGSSSADHLIDLRSCRGRLAIWSRSWSEWVIASTWKIATK